MTMLEIIEKKKFGQELTREEIAFFAQAAAEKSVPDYQLSALLMAIRLNGMTDQETTDLTLAMRDSGDIADLSGIPGIKVDKHSTGGVGDTTTLVLAPLVAACGAPVAKMSGRGLGHTGGTLDKLESIPGLSVALPVEDFIRQVKDIGVAVVGQTGRLAPADKTLYSLRDVTSTVDSLPLIVSSILSKKLAAGSDAIVLDVKTGSGAIMHTLEDSLKLAQNMVRVGELAGKAETPEAGQQMMKQAIDSGAGLAKLRQMIAAQGGDPSVCDDVNRLPQAQVIRPVTCGVSGWVSKMNTMALGLAAQAMGAGRMKVDDELDYSVGFVLQVRIGDRVEAGTPLCVLHARSEEDADRAEAAIRAAITIGREACGRVPNFYAVVTKDGIRRLGADA